MNPEEKYERIHLAHIAVVDAKLKRAYNKVIKRILAGKTLPKTLRKNFKLATLPDINNELKKAMVDFRAELMSIYASGLNYSWELANRKTNEFIAKNIDTKGFTPEMKKLIKSPNKLALEAFINRRQAGLNLSDRVWKYTGQFKLNIEQVIEDGIRNRQSVSTVARNLQQYLVEPDKKFRRVRNAADKLVPSTPAKNYHPGQGIYKSSYLNAKRLAFQEINMAYRLADQAKFKQLPFIVGYEVKLSPNHPKYDICDSLQGRYPTSFVFRSWHVFCICYVVPIFADTDEIVAFQEAQKAGKRFTFTNVVPNGIPARVKRWVRNNSEELERYKRLPYFMADNKIKLS